MLLFMRSFMLATTERQRRSDTSFFPELRLIARTAIQNLAELARPKPKFKRWSSTSYFESESSSPDQQLKRLSIDLTTFFHEYVGMFAKKIYPYSKFGILDGYDIPIVEVCQNYEQIMKTEGKKTARAELETWTAQILETWMGDESIKVGQKLISISPRGSLEEGYPGTKSTNYVFINIYHKLDDNSCQLIQLTSFDSHEQLLALQRKWQNSDAVLYQALPLPFSVVEESHQIISQPVCTATDFSLAKIEANVYEFKDSWPIRVEDLPQLDEVQFSRQLQAVIQFCTDQYQASLTTENGSAAFDTLIEIVRQDFLKWVEAHAANYQAGNKHDGDLNLENIGEHWKLAKKKVNGQEMNKTEKQTLKTLSSLSNLNPFGTLSRLTSLAHCVAGTPASMALTSLQLDGVSRFNVGEMQLGFNQLSSSEQRETISMLHQLTKLYIQNRATGQTEIWYVLIHDPEAYAAYYVHGCYRENASSQIMGPCDVPLDLKDSLIDASWLISESQYLSMQELSFANELTALLGGQTGENCDYAQSLIAKLSHKLFKVTVSDLILGQVSMKAGSAFELPFNYYQTLAASMNPIATLESMVNEDEPTGKFETWKQLAA